MKRAMLAVVVAACGHGAAAPVAPAPTPSPDAADPIPVTDAGAPIATAPVDARPADAHKPPPTPSRNPAKVVQINQPGVLVDLDANTVAGHVTIVDFWATWCGGCKIIEAKFMATIDKDARVVVRKVDVGDGDTPVAKHYGVHGLPQIWIYDAKKRLRYVLVANDALKAGDIAISLAGEAP